MLFGKFRILGKLALLVLVPLLGVVALSVPIIINRVDAARDAQATSDTVELASRVGTAVQELQEERLLAIGYLFGLVDQPAFVVQSAEADDALARVDDDVTVPRELARALRNAGKLENTRQNVLNKAIRPDTVGEPDERLFVTLTAVAGTTLADAKATGPAQGARTVVPGAAFFQLAGGKIRRLRLYLPDGERAEVEPERKKP